MEEGNKFNVAQDAIRKREEEFLVTLREMKESILKDKQAENMGGGNNNAASASSLNEITSLREENDRLKAKMTKQEYRISHLVTGMETLFEQQKKE